MPLSLPTTYPAACPPPPAESTVVAQLLNRRYAVLHTSVFSTYRRETGDAHRCCLSHGYALSDDAGPDETEVAPLRPSPPPSSPPPSCMHPDDAPSKVWPVTHATMVSEVQGSIYHLRHKHTSTLMAVARGEPLLLPLLRRAAVHSRAPTCHPLRHSSFPAGRYEEKTMWGFTVTWHSYTQAAAGGDALKLAWDTEAEAEAWRAAFASAITHAVAARGLR